MNLRLDSLVLEKLYQFKSVSKACKQTGVLHCYLAINYILLWEWTADDTSALEDFLKKVGAVDVLYGPAPTAGTNTPQTDGDRADFLVKLMSHVRLHLLYLAEKLQEQLVTPEGEMAAAGTVEQTKSQVTHHMLY